jgi:alpha-1,2-mannosyltransferase
MDQRLPGRLLIGLFCFLYLPLVWWHGWKLIGSGNVDFPSYYYGAKLAFVEKVTPYGPHAFDAASAQMWMQVNPYLYPPPSLLAFWPLAWMTFPIAKATFLIASHLCYLGSVWLLLRRITPLPKAEHLRDLTLLLGLGYLLLFDPMIVTLNVGQVNLIAVFFICLALAALRNGKASWQVALPLSVAILLKTYPVLLLIPLTFRRRFRDVALTCVFFGVFAAVATFVLPSNAWQTWLRDVVPAGGYANTAIATAGPWNQNINAWVTRLFVDTPFAQPLIPAQGIARPVGMGLALVVVGVTLWNSFQLRRGDRLSKVADEEIAMFLLMIFLVAPLSWEHHLVYILPAALLALRMLISGELRPGWATVVATALFIIAWKIPFDHPGLTRGWWTLLISIKFYAAIALWIFFVTRVRKASGVADRTASETGAGLVPAEVG